MSQKGPVTLDHESNRTHNGYVQEPSRYTEMFENTAFHKLENIVEKGENVCNQHFLLFPQHFFPYEIQKS